MGNFRKKNNFLQKIYILNTQLKYSGDNSIVNVDPYASGEWENHKT